jgi:hypothetical protein
MSSAPIPILLGAAAPADLSALMYAWDAADARGLSGLRGTPVTELVRALIEAGRPVEICALAELGFFSVGRGRRDRNGHGYGAPYEYGPGRDTADLGVRRSDLS